MFQGMTTGMRSQSEIALFIHHMIPHHQNAVNMAKSLLHSRKIPCADLTDEDDPLCIMNAMMRDIINGQNFQIQVMRKVLEALNLPQTDNCEAPLDGSPFTMEGINTDTSSGVVYSQENTFRQGKFHRRLRRNV
jgi:Domain of unknown function (DUF305)